MTFEGWVRNRNDGRAVQSAGRYEAYALPAGGEGGRADPGRGAGSVSHCGRVRRAPHGRAPCGLGDLAVWVGVAAEHRGAAFDACRYIIDETKARLPIWKREHYADGAADWINCASK